MKSRRASRSVPPRGGVRRAMCGRNRRTFGSMVLGLICFLIARWVATRLRPHTRVWGRTATAPALTRVRVAAWAVFEEGRGPLCR